MMRIESMDTIQQTSTTSAASGREDIQNKVQTDSSQETKNTNEMSQNEKNSLPISEKIVIEAIEKANKAFQGVNTEVKFSIHEKTRQIMVKVFNKDNGEVIREIPSEKILDMVASICEMSGLIVDEKR